MNLLFYAFCAFLWLKSDLSVRYAAKHLAASLDKFKVPEKEKGEILAFVTTLKNDIVEK